MNDHGKSEWEALYKQGKYNCISPYTQPFSFLSRYRGNDAQGEKLLEVGCGSGHNLVFAKWALGYDVYGIDQSESGIEMAKKRFEKHNLKYEFLGCANMVDLDFEDSFFDVVIDRGAIQHNSYKTLKKIISEVYRVLKTGGLFYSDVTSDMHPISEHSNKGDYYLNKIGIWHYFSKSEILELYDKFEMLQWYHTIRQDLPNNKISSASYHMEMRKK